MNFLSLTEICITHMVLELPLKKGYLGQKSTTFIGSYIWDKLSNNFKVLNTLFTHNYILLVFQNFRVTSS